VRSCRHVGSSQHSYHGGSSPSPSIAFSPRCLSTFFSSPFFLGLCLAKSLKFPSVAFSLLLFPIFWGLATPSSSPRVREQFTVFRWREKWRKRECSAGKKVHHDWLLMRLRNLSVLEQVHLACRRWLHCRCVLISYVSVAVSTPVTLLH
jgi:hypothetical protein